MEAKPYTQSDWMIIVILGTLVLEALGPNPTFVTPIIVTAFAVMMRLWWYLFRIIPNRMPWILVLPGLIAYGIFHYGTEGLFYLVTKTPIANAGNTTLCLKDHEAKDAPPTPSPAQ